LMLDDNIIWLSYSFEEFHKPARFVTQT
jgi:hypothetical protein